MAISTPTLMVMTRRSPTKLRNRLFDDKGQEKPGRMAGFFVSNISFGALFGSSKRVRTLACGEESGVGQESSTRPALSVDCPMSREAKPYSLRLVWAVLECVTAQINPPRS